MARTGVEVHDTSRKWSRAYATRVAVYPQLTIRIQELEMAEAKFGWVPQHEAIASRVRRRYRFAKGGHPQLILIHYSRGQSISVSNSLLFFEF